MSTINFLIGSGTLPNMLYSPSQKHRNSGFTFVWGFPTQFHVLVHYTWTCKKIGHKVVLMISVQMSILRTIILVSTKIAIVSYNVWSEQIFFLPKQSTVTFLCHLFCFSLFYRKYKEKIGSYFCSFKRNYWQDNNCHYQQYWTRQLLSSNTAGSDILVYSVSCSRILL